MTKTIAPAPQTADRPKRTRVQSGTVAWTIPLFRIDETPKPASRKRGSNQVAESPRGQRPQIVLTFESDAERTPSANRFRRPALTTGFLPRRLVPSVLHRHRSRPNCLSMKPGSRPDARWFTRSTPPILGARPGNPRPRKPRLDPQPNRPARSLTIADNAANARHRLGGRPCAR